MIKSLLMQDHEEYTTFRQELVSIIQSRYTILGLVIGAFRVFSGLIFGTEDSFVIKDSEYDIAAIFPLTYTFFLIPGMLIIYHLTLHYRRIDAYLWAKYGEDKEFPFQEAYEEFRDMQKQKSGYREGFVIYFGCLCMFALFISFIMFSPNLTWPPQVFLPNIIFYFGILTLFISPFIFWFYMSNKLSRKKTKKFRDDWKKALNIIESKSHSQNNESTQPEANLDQS